MTFNPKSAMPGPELIYMDRVLKPLSSESALMCACCPCSRAGAGQNLKPKDPEPLNPER